LDFLNSASLDVAREFCRISIEFLKNGINSKVYHVAAQKLDIEAVTVQSAIEGLMHLLLESSKLMLNELDFHDSMKALGFSEDLQKELVARYLENRVDIRRIQSDMSVDLPHYRDLEWRLDIQLASRSMRHQVEPLMTLKLHTTEPDHRERVQVLQTDPANLLHLTRTLENALKEMNTAHCRRIVRNL
jgi:hypothetical protein